MSPVCPLSELRNCTHPRLQWDDSTMRTVRTAAPGPDRPATYSVLWAPGELPVAAWRLEHGSTAEISGAFEEHTHDFPGLAFFPAAGGRLRTGRRTWPIEAGDLFVVAPGDVMGHIDAEDLTDAHGWGVFF